MEIYGYKNDQNNKLPETEFSQSIGNYFNVFHFVLEIKKKN